MLQSEVDMISCSLVLNSGFLWWGEPTEGLDDEKVNHAGIVRWCQAPMQYQDMRTEIVGQSVW